MAKQVFPSDQQDKFMLRLPSGMRERIKFLSDYNGRSMNAEIVERLNASFEEHQGISVVRIDFSAPPSELFEAAERLLNMAEIAMQRAAALLLNPDIAEQDGIKLAPRRIEEINTLTKYIQSAPSLVEAVRRLKQVNDNMPQDAGKFFLGPANNGKPDHIRVLFNPAESSADELNNMTVLTADEHQMLSDIFLGRSADSNEIQVPTQQVDMKSAG